jgi:translation initiation factor 3 subunit E
MALQAFGNGRIRKQKKSIDAMAQWDLTKKLVPFLDRHLIFPILLNPSLAELYKPEDVQLALYELAKSTDLVDYTITLFEKVFPDQPVPEGLMPAYNCFAEFSIHGLKNIEFATKRASTLSSINRLEQEAQAVLDVIENPDVAQALRQDKLQNLQYLKDTYGVRLIILHNQMCVAQNDFSSLHWTKSPRYIISANCNSQ